VQLLDLAAQPRNLFLSGRIPTRGATRSSADPPTLQLTADSHRHDGGARQVGTLCLACTTECARSLNVDGLPSFLPTQNCDAHAEHEHEEADEPDAGYALDHAR
jgi:hypothetical protein